MENLALPDSLLEKAKHIRLLICDVDGVLTKGEVFLGNAQEELKAFNIKDGLGLKLLMDNKVKVAIITGRESHIVERRMQELGVTHLYQNQKNKISAFEQLLSQLKLKPEQVAHVGDDLPDLPLMKRAGLGIAVSDAHWFVKQQADWVTNGKGGQGAVREICDSLLLSRGLLDGIHQSYLATE